MNPNQITLASFDVICYDERFGHSIGIARGAKSYDLICLQCADTEKYIFSYNGEIPQKYDEQFRSSPYENIFELEHSPYCDPYCNDYKKLKNSELFVYMKFSYQNCFNKCKEAQQR